MNRTLLTFLITFSCTALSEGRPLNWLDHYRTCFQRFDVYGGLPDVQEVFNDHEQYSFFQGTHNGNGGYWVVYNGMGTFVEIPSGETGRFLFWGGNTRGGTVQIPGGKTLYFTGRLETQDIHQGHSRHQLQVTSRPLSGHSYSNTAGSSHILDESIRPDIEAAILAKVGLLGRLAHAPLAPDYGRGAARIFSGETDEEGRSIELPRRPDPLSRDQRRPPETLPDDWVKEANSSQVQTLERCLEDLGRIQPRPDRVIDAIRGKLKELHIPQLPVRPDGSRDSPQTI